MAQRLPDIDVNKKGVEIDPDGIPYYKWPPFPDPPDGVKIIPFNEFKPSGIQIRLNGEEEVDGLGIPTVRLAVTHNNEAPSKKRKIKKNSAGEEIRQKTVWWEDWEEGEEQRIQSVKSYDRNLHAKVRIAEAVEDFKRIHDWKTPSMRLLEWYGKLLNYLGLNDVRLRPRFGRNQREGKEPEDEDDDDDAGDDAGKPSQPIKAETFDETKHDVKQNNLSAEEEERLLQKFIRIKEAQEIRLEAFIDDPYLATKIFFSCYFRDSGMMWETRALRDSPRIIEFFLKFLLETRALFEEETALKRAIAVARKAKEELPLTLQIGQRMPDELSQCLKAIYGSRLKKFSWGDESNEAAADADFKAQVKESSGIIVSDLTPEPSSTPDNDRSTNVDPAPPPKADDTTSGWNNIGTDTGGWGTGAPSWDNGIDNSNDDPWAAQATQQNDDWTFSDPHFLMPLLGPTMLPITHDIGYVEDSTRYVDSVSLPDTKGTSTDNDKGASTSSDLFRSFARVVLSPYPSFAAPSAPRAAIQPPELIEDPWTGISPDATEKPYIPRHDPRNDNITILVGPELGKLLASGIRMGLGGTFVQVVPKHNGSTSESPQEDPGKVQAVGESFWYAEKILQVIPSFWTERQI